MIRVGIDVGGTNTDAAVMDGDRVLGAVKRPTSEDVLTGVVDAIGAVIAESGVAPAQVEAVMIGTTQFTNAVIERRRLAKTAVLRLGLPATASVPPFEDWPEDLRSAIGGVSAIVHGGREFDGRTISEVDPAEILSTVSRWAEEGVEAVAVSAVFSPAYPEQERQVVSLIEGEFPQLDVVASGDIGGLGLLERENAAALNASLRPFARKVVEAFRGGVARHAPGAAMYITQNDGTLIGAEVAERFPVLTFASGPTNSMRGAAFLSGVQDALVLDVGGTTADIGAIAGGFPRASAVAATFAEVRTNFRMPDLLSFGLGGGSLVRGEEPAIGPDSVGYRIASEALVFGGGTLTATDLAVAGGMAEIGDPAAVAGLDPRLVSRGIASMRAMVEDALDRMRTSREDQPVIVVGGGSILVPGELAGAARVIRPPHFEIANAVGAAIAQVSGEFDAVQALDRSREELLADAVRIATDEAVAQGADPESVRVVELEEIPVAYVDGAMTRIRAKVVGELRRSSDAPAPAI